MATLREIRGRIKGVKNTQQITKAMKMVAAAKMRRAQDRMLSARPYATKIKELIQNLAASVDNPDSPLLSVRPEEKMLLVVVAADKGLCGAFNSNVIKAAQQEVSKHSDKQVSLLCVGKKIHEFFSKRDYSVYKSHVQIFQTLDFTNAQTICNEVVDAFVGEEFDSVKLIYNEFKSVGSQQLVVSSLLPVNVDELEEVSSTEYLYEPGQVEILKALLPRYLNTQIWRALLESFASEQAARMIAMENATENANDLIRDLTLQFNKARQAAITTEILEIVGGAEALKASS
ncbi:MAG: ATP synthase F1 subunit gamma [Calditrichia bacterium]